MRVRRAVAHAPVRDAFLAGKPFPVTKHSAAAVFGLLYKLPVADAYSWW